MYTLNEEIKNKNNEERQKTREIEKQTQIELKFAANRSKQLVVRLKLSSTGTKKMNNHQIQAQKASDEAVIPEESEGAISITSRDRRMRASKQFDA